MYDKSFLPSLSSFLPFVPRLNEQPSRSPGDDRLLEETLHAHHSPARRHELWEESRLIISEAVRRMTFVRFASANIASALRTLCIPDLVEGVNHTKKIETRPMSRVAGTYAYLHAVYSYPYYSGNVRSAISRVNSLHRRARVAGNKTERQRQLFKYIASNLHMAALHQLPDLTPRERHAICQHMVLSVFPMGHDIQATTLELERDLVAFEREHRIDDTVESAIRNKAINVAHTAHDVIILHPLVSPKLLYEYVPDWTCRILKLSRPSRNYYDIMRDIFATRLADNRVVSRSTHDIQARLFLVTALNELVFEKHTSFKLPEADRLMRIISKRLYRD
ncbi:MAG: hypothetical protein KDB27_27380 [Planctomycetales bacterium]|nr:hypothetical protein [Planctomycetales bacterium]